MADLDHIIDRADRVNAGISCPDCSFDEPLSDFLQRENRVDRKTETVHFGCPACSSDTVDLGRREGGGPTNIVVHGLEELEQLAGE